VRTFLPHEAPFCESRPACQAEALPIVALEPPDLARKSPFARLGPYKRHRFPAEIISQGVWLYFRFCLSYRDVEELMAERGISLAYEAVRSWCRKFGQAYANALRQRHPRPGDKWQLDEVFLTICGERHYLWRAVDQDGQSSIGNTAISTTGRRTRTSPPASGSGACRASSLQDTRSGSSRRMGQSPSTSDHDVTSSLLLSTAKRCASDSILGGKSPASLQLRKGRELRELCLPVRCSC
jgi:DDE domain